MGNINIHNASKLGLVKHNFNLVSMGNTVGNKSHYRKVYGVVNFPEIQVVFPAGNLIFSIDYNEGFLTNNAKIPVIIRTIEDIDLSQYQVEFYRDTNKYFLNQEILGYQTSSLTYHSQLKAYYTDYFLVLPNAISRVNYNALNTQRKTLYLTTIYFYIKLKKEETYCGTSAISSFTVSFKNPELVKGYIFPDIENLYSIHTDGAFFDGNVYYKELGVS